VLEDAANGVKPSQGPDTSEAPTEDLPNLQVQTWTAKYNPVPRGDGNLEYSIVNTGTGTATHGANVCLIMSEDPTFYSFNNYVVCEDIQYDLPPGWEVYRNSQNSIPFKFPDHIEPGIYYMAVWVDDINEVVESNENDNLMYQSGTTEITNSKADLAIQDWYATWDQTNGDGSLIYTIYNFGDSVAPQGIWDVNLVLSNTLPVGSGDTILIFNEPSIFDLKTNHYIYRNATNPAYFNIFKDIYGNTVPNGIYYISLWIDDLNNVDESNEVNNVSTSWSFVSIYSNGNFNVLSMDENSILPKKSENSAYNGKLLDSQSRHLLKVQLSERSDGAKQFRVLEKMEKTPFFEEKDCSILTKKTKSFESLIFPIKGSIPMPND
jgi:hypothetical protein